jgi:large subunit ribosomal protein L13
LSFQEATTVFPPPSRQPRWVVIDAEGQVLGRLATRIANLLRGKDRPLFTPFRELGDFVVVVNAAKVRLTGKKEQHKVYETHSGYPGGFRRVTAGEVRSRFPERLLEWAVWGMLPPNRRRKHVIRRLKIYAGPEHPHAAQKPVPVRPGRLRNVEAAS